MFVTLQELESHPKLNDLSLILYSIMAMDSYFLNSLLSEEIDYEEIGKDAFVGLLHDRFNQYKSRGDTELILQISYCKSCNCDSPVFKFVGNRSKESFALYFEISNDQIIDIYHCRSFEGLN